MKRSPLVLGIVCALFSTAVLASESWILDIPVRGIANQETGEVRMIMGLNAAPAGSQLVVNGTATLNLGDTQVVNGDFVSFAAGSGNEVRITYKPLSNFGADFCAGGAAIEKQIPMRFVGAQEIVDFRMSSYIVAAPNAECSQVSKHTGDTPANVQAVGDGVAPALVATFKGRNPFDVVVVLDKSGSMADLPPGSAAGPVKADILKSAVQGFVSQWEQLDAPVPGGKDDSPDRLGVVFFDSTAAAQTLPGADPPANFFLQRGGANAWDAVINKANTLSPGSSTSIGAGVNEGMKQWKSDPKNDLSVVVVTDGMQNTAPLITPTGSGFLGLTPVSGLDTELRKRFIPIQTIGFGTPAQVDEDLLRNMSLETSGVSYIAINSTTMFDVFGMTLVALLKGNTAAIATRDSDTITGKGPTAPHPGLVDSSAQRGLFSLQWAPRVRKARRGRVERTREARPRSAPRPGAVHAQRLLPREAPRLPVLARQHPRHHRRQARHPRAGGVGRPAADESSRRRDPRAHPAPDRGPRHDPARRAARGAERHDDDADRRHPMAARREARLVQGTVAARSHHAEGRGHDRADGGRQRRLLRVVRSDGDPRHVRLRSAARLGRAPDRAHSPRRAPRGEPRREGRSGEDDGDDRADEARPLDRDGDTARPLRQLPRTRLRLGDPRAPARRNRLDHRGAGGCAGDGGLRVQRARRDDDARGFGDG